MNVLVLGAGGGLGQLVAAELIARGHTVATVDRARARDPQALARCGGEAIINCAGASVALEFGRGWRGYRAVDTPIGLAAVEAARRTGVRLVYVGVHHTPAFARCRYVDAHERVARAMREIDGVVIRPTGFHAAFAALVPLARRGLLLDVGDGRARTNPIDERELAAIVAHAITGPGPHALSVGGPEVLCRREIFERVAAVAGRPVKIRRVPAWFAGLGAAALAVVHPRIGQFARFAALLARHDMIAPARGTRTLASYLGEAPIAA